MNLGNTSDYEPVATDLKESPGFDWFPSQAKARLVTLLTWSGQFALKGRLRCPVEGFHFPIKGLLLLHVASLPATEPHELGRPLQLVCDNLLINVA